MYKRNISLYYGSISLWCSLQGIGIWFMSLFVSASSQRNRLHEIIKQAYCSSSAGVFSFGSGRSALTACLKAARIGPGDDVLVSAYTCLAVPTAIIAAGARPIYIDINPKSLNVECHAVLEAITPRVKAIIVQHTLGKAASIKQVVEQVRERGILVIEDCALSVGTKIDAQYVGTFADAAIISMELSKTLSVGWGGILIINNNKFVEDVVQFYAAVPNPSWYSAARDIWQTVISSWCHQPRVPYLLKKYILAVGFKSHIFRPSTPTLEFAGIIGSDFLVKMGGGQAGFAALQWGNFSKIISSCEKNANELRELLTDLNIFIPGEPENNEVSVAPRVSILVTNRATTIDYFMEKGIELGQWFDGPLSPMPTDAAFNYQMGSYPLAESVALHVVNLPCHSRLTKNDLKNIANHLIKFSQDYSECLVYSKMEFAKI